MTGLIVRNVNFTQRGESFGEIGFLDGKGGRSATVTALANGQVLEIRRAEVTRLLKEAPNIALAMLTAQSRVVRNAIWSKRRARSSMDI